MLLSKHACSFVTGTFFFFFCYCCCLHFVLLSSFSFFLGQSSVYILVFFNYVICASCTMVKGRHFSRTKKNSLGREADESGEEAGFSFKDVVDLQKCLEMCVIERLHSLSTSHTIFFFHFTWWHVCSSLCPILFFFPRPSEVRLVQPILFKNLFIVTQGRDTHTYKKKNVHSFKALYSTISFPCPDDVCCFDIL